ncbi:hypothetical protein BPAE_0399g00040 [Botrytis paeoniae]|uniref:Uncharacterized protein n=1 Tax=Botrytis paeoniae TaxID=278948 RepID=A0A4Z1F9N9_9HELO|nr:hypothetical protein BPAE_0399g00040 [Botrytis paeoniae]
MSNAAQGYHGHFRQDADLLMREAGAAYISEIDGIFKNSRGRHEWPKSNGCQVVVTLGQDPREILSSVVFMVKPYIISRTFSSSFICTFAKTAYYVTAQPKGLFYKAEADHIVREYGSPWDYGREMRV